MSSSVAAGLGLEPPSGVHVAREREHGGGEGLEGDRGELGQEGPQPDEHGLLRAPGVQLIVVDDLAAEAGGREWRAEALGRTRRVCERVRAG